MDPSYLLDDEESTTASGGVYRIRDNISNFRIRVYVKRMSSSSMSSTSASTETLTEDIIDDVIVSWQQKVFSKAEYSKFENARESDFNSNEGEDVNDHSNDGVISENKNNNVLKMKFFQDVQKLKKSRKEKPNNLIYTTIDSEISYDDDQLALETPLLDNSTADSEPNFLSALMADGLRRRTHHNVTSIPTSNIVIEQPTRETQLRLHTMNILSSQSMIIKLDLNQEDDDAFVELCVLKMRGNDVLEVKPDFTHNKKPYKLEVNGKELYEYWIEHASLAIDKDDQQHETLIMNEVLGRHANLIANEVGTDFENPHQEQRIFRMMVNAEIISAHSYDYDNLFVHYFVNLPDGWKLTQHESKESCTFDYAIHGITQTCSTTVIDNKDTAHFCHTFDFDINFDINRLDYVPEHLPPRWPQIFVEVLSIDSWSRVRTEGYGFTNVPFTPGTYNIPIDTWRPLLNGGENRYRIGEMRRYFIGGTPELDDITSYGLNDDSVLSRYGFRTISTGTVQLRLDTIHHSPVAFMNNKGNRKKQRNHLMDRLTAATLLNSVTSVLKAFSSARERLLKATQGHEGRMEAIQEHPE